MNSLFEQLWYNPEFLYKKSAHGLFFGILYLLSFGYRFIIFIRKKCYQWAIFHSFSANIPVIVVGNITVGGTGKTPLIIALAEYLKEVGHRPGIVSRGYGGKSTLYPLSVTEKTLPQEAGDEPVLLASRTQCPVVVSPKRIEAIQFLQNHFDCTVILSDDGLQHLAMGRDMEIIVIDGERRFGNGFCLPAGPLREPINRCKTTDFLVTNQGLKQDDVLYPSEYFTEYEMRLRAENFISVNTHKKSVPLDFFKRKSVHVITGIGNPHRFLSTLTALEIAYDKRIFTDHHRFVQKDIEFNDLEQMPIIMTEKDAVKCQYLTASNDMYYLKISAEMNASFKEAFLKQFESIVEKKKWG